MGTTGSNDGYASNYGAFGCLEIGAATGTFYQTVTGLTPGLYAVSAQAFFDINDESPYTDGAYDTPNTTTASNAYLYANDEKLRFRFSLVMTTINSRDMSISIIKDSVIQTSNTSAATFRLHISSHKATSSLLTRRSIELLFT